MYRERERERGGGNVGMVINIIISLLFCEQLISLLTKSSVSMSKSILSRFQKQINTKNDLPLQDRDQRVRTTANFKSVCRSITTSVYIACFRN